MSLSSCLAGIPTHVLRHHHVPSSSCLLNQPVLHRLLHSFPTRRSSDLESCLEQDVLEEAAEQEVRADMAGAYERTGEEETAAERSEEHTSELQSRFDIVCRLLLEQKKL